jgi:hypothetical protein
MTDQGGLLTFRRRPVKLPWNWGPQMVVGLVAMGSAVASVPHPTPNAFASANYGLTFHTPPVSSYCALPHDWVGSDHGTVIFLAPPKRCSGAGYASSGRGFDGNVPRIQVYYGYDTVDDEDQKPAPCKEIGRVAFLGRLRQLCRTSSRHGIEVSVSAKYKADIPAEAIFTLVTSPARQESDLQAFRVLLQSARTCTATWTGGKSGLSSFTTGSGPPCPTGARFF